MDVDDDDIITISLILMLTLCSSEPFTNTQKTLSEIVSVLTASVFNLLNVCHFCQEAISLR